METVGERDISGGSNHEGGVIRGWAGEIGEGGAGEGGIPIGVEKRAIKAGENRWSLTVCPGVAMIEVGEFLKGEVMNEGVEFCGEATVEVLGVFVMGVAEEVEVSDDQLARPR